MRKHRTLFWRPGCLFALTVFATVTSLVAWMIWNELRARYTYKVLISLPSPTGAWTARVIEDTVEGPLSTNMGDEVELVSKARPNDSTDLLGVETQGDNDFRPRIAWSAPYVLRVTVPNTSRLKVLARHADGVQVDVHFDPDDPAARATARAAWLKQIGDSPD